MEINLCLKKLFITLLFERSVFLVEYFYFLYKLFLYYNNQGMQVLKILRT